MNLWRGSTFSCLANMMAKKMDAEIIWSNYHKALLPDTAPHIHITIDKEGLLRKIREKGALFARYVSDFDKSQDGSFWYVIKDQPTEMSDLSSNTRNQIRKALKGCRVEQVDKKFMLEHGYAVYAAAHKTYAMAASSEKDFIQDIQTEQREYWAVIERESGTVISYAKNLVEHEMCHYVAVKTNPEYLKLYPNYALFFTMDQHYLNERKLRYVNDGAKSILHDTNIQDFLISKFKFRRAYCKLHIIYLPSVAFLVQILFPFRSLLAKIKFGPFSKVNAILAQEEMRRNS